MAHRQLVFGEGHQFDSDTRGITYELLLTSLRSMIPLRVLTYISVFFALQGTSLDLT